MSKFADDLLAFTNSVDRAMKEIEPRVPPIKTIFAMWKFQRATDRAWFKLYRKRARKPGRFVLWNWSPQ